jgi:hypothetical protein
MNMRDLFLSSAYVLCIHCYPFLWIVLFCLRLMSCVSIVTRFSELSFFVFALCLVYPMLPVSLNWPFLFSSYVLCIHCFPFLWIVLFCLRLMSCVSNVTRFSELSFFVFVLCLVYPLLPVSLNCPFLSSSYVLCIHCFPFLWIVLFCLRLMSCVSIVTRFSELSFFVFVLCLVYPLLPVSLNCPCLIAPNVYLHLN